MNEDNLAKQEESVRKQEAMKRGTMNKRTNSLGQRFIGSLLFFSLYRGVCLILQATGFLRRLNSSLCEITSFVKSLVDSLARAHPTTPFQ